MNQLHTSYSTVPHLPVEGEFFRALKMTLIKNCLKTQTWLTNIILFGYASLDSVSDTKILNTTKYILSTKKFEEPFLKLCRDFLILHNQYGIYVIFCLGYTVYNEFIY